MKEFRQFRAQACDTSGRVSEIRTRNRIPPSTHAGTKRADDPFTTPAPHSAGALRRQRPRAGGHPRPESSMMQFDTPGHRAVGAGQQIARPAQSRGSTPPPSLACGL